MRDKIKNIVFAISGIYLLGFVGGIESIYEQNLWGCYIAAIVSAVVVYKNAKDMEADI